MKKNMKSFLGEVVIGDVVFDGQVTTVVLGCIESRITSIMQNLIKLENCEAGSYFHANSPGAVTSIVYGSSAQKTTQRGMIELLLDKGVNKFIIMVHTDCAGDGGSARFSNHDEELQYQIHKAKQAQVLIEAMCSQKNLIPEFSLYLIDIHKKKITVRRILEIEHASAVTV